MSVNLSGAQLQGDALVSQVAATLQRTGIQPAALTLEVTETMLVADPGAVAVLERLKDLLWNRYPFGSLDDFLREVVEDYLSRHDPELKLRERELPPPRAEAASSRRPAGRVRDLVWARDGGRCAFLSAEERRCECRRGLELDHIVPFSAGGRSDDPANLRLLCREHNQYERRRLLGEGRSGLLR